MMFNPEDPEEDHIHLRSLSMPTNYRHNDSNFEHFEEQHISHDLEDEAIQQSIILDTSHSSTGSFRWRHFGLSEPETLEKTAVVKRIAAILNKWWNTTFLITYVIAVSIDPVFFYIPLINEEKMCLGMDKKLRTAALVFRSLTDITFIVHIIYSVLKANKTVGVRGYSSWKFSLVLGRHILIDILAVLPIPQVLIVVVFFNMKGSAYMNITEILIVFVVAQYALRISQLRKLFNKVLKVTRLWVKVQFNFFLYILTSHVLGAFWYLFSILREISCWRYVCVAHNTCINALYCDDNGSRNITLLDELCPINSPNATVFDFGIFLDSLQSGNIGSINFMTKFFYSFWWGLRNLSNFGTNLETSNYMGENCFAIFISVTGFLFVYLIGNDVQTYMQLEKPKWKPAKAGRLKEARQKRILKEESMHKWEESIGKWEVPEDLKEEIMKHIPKILEENKYADPSLVNLFSILSRNTSKRLKSALCMGSLSKVPRLQDMDVKVLKLICDYLKPVIYPEKSWVFQADELLDCMIFITEGTIGITAGDSEAAGQAKTFLGRGDWYGDEQLLSWVFPNMEALNYSTTPICEENVKCETIVEGFELSAEDLINVVSKCKFLWKFPNSNEVMEVAADPTTGTANRRRFHNGPEKPTLEVDPTAYKGL